MPTPVTPVSFLYRLIRRLRVIDATCLLQMDTPHRDASVSLADGYRIERIGAKALAEHLEKATVEAQVGTPDKLGCDERCLVGVTAGDRLVSFLWIAKDHIAGNDNYSRAPHLGTSIDLPQSAVFVYNAWTDPDHRGKRLVAAQLQYILKHRLLEAQSLVTSIDWTNKKSIRAFEHFGMQRLGTVVRIGRGPVQVSFVPKLASLDLRVAADAPGLRIELP